MSIVDASEIDSLREDARRWRALMASGRIHFMGCAGFLLERKDPNAPRSTDNLTPTVRDGNYLHFGMEFWSNHPAAGDPKYSDKFERELLIAYADSVATEKGIK